MGSWQSPWVSVGQSRQEIGWTQFINPGFTSFSLHRVFKKASPNGKVSLCCVRTPHCPHALGSSVD